MGIWKDIKYALNSTLGTSRFAPLNEIISGGTKTFTSNGTFIVPAGITKILITACAGGGGGGAYYNHDGNYYYGGSGGGGGEAIYKKAFNVTPKQSISIKIGKGGIKSSTSTPGKAGNGGNTIIGSLITLKGGEGGMTGYAPNDSYEYNPLKLTNPGGAGGGYGGRGSYVNNYRDDYAIMGGCNGQDGLFGKGGISNNIIIQTNDTSNYHHSNSTVSGGGGGGSLGNGGNPSYKAMGVGIDVLATKPGYGGGGAGGSFTRAYGELYYSYGSDGGNGIVIIEW